MTRPQPLNDLSPQICLSPPHRSVESFPDPAVASIEEFFRYRPQTFNPAKNHTGSTNTRPPSSFDRHLDARLILRRIVYVPSIIEDLQRIAEHALKSASEEGRLPSISNSFPSYTVRHRDRLQAPYGTIVGEEQIKEIYEMTTAKFCSVVASTLEFRHSHWACGYLGWTTKTRKTRGIADGFLRLNPTTVDKGVPPLADDFKMVAETFPVIGIWEFKNLLAGSSAAFEAIVQQSSYGDFHWEVCEYGKRCPIVHPGQGGRAEVTGSKVGFDVQIPICQSLLIEDSDQTKPPLPPFSLSKLDKMHARYITQQVWTEAVNEDATFIVINSGTYEIIGIRDRANQTLYITGVIMTSDSTCHYGKLHTGLFIAAIRDARVRSLRLQNFRPQPDSWTISYSLKKPRNIHMRSILKDLFTCDWLAIVAGPGYGQRFPFQPNAFWIRTPLLNPARERQARESLYPFIRIRVIEHIRSRVYRGDLEFCGVSFKGIPGEWAKTVVVKNADGLEDINKLAYETTVHLLLRNAGVTAIPKVLGFFQYTSVEGDESLHHNAVLVMEDVGQPLNDDIVSRSHITAFFEALASVHNAGYHHRNLLRENLMLNKENMSISIVGLGHARPTKSEHAGRNELEGLLRLLPNPLKRSGDGNHTSSFLDMYPGSRSPTRDDPDASPPRLPRPKKRRETS